MDEVVKQAMRKWPNVPHCMGWLALDARGQWWIRDEEAQSRGAFSSGRPGAKGMRLRHERLIEFIGRNYAADAQGRWYFQNGPQRVFVELESAPWVWRIQTPDEESAAPQVRAHTGLRVRWQRGLVDELGLLYGLSELGLGRVHPQDMGLAADAIVQGAWPEPDAVRAKDLPARFGFVRSPQAHGVGSGAKV